METMRIKEICVESTGEQGISARKFSIRNEDMKYTLHSHQHGITTTLLWDSRSSHNTARSTLEDEKRSAHCASTTQSYRPRRLGGLLDLDCPLLPHPPVPRRGGGESLLGNGTRRPSLSLSLSLSRSLSLPKSPPPLPPRAPRGAGPSGPELPRQCPPPRPEPGPGFAATAPPHPPSPRPPPAPFQPFGAGPTALPLMASSPPSPAGTLAPLGSVTMTAR